MLDFTTYKVNLICIACSNLHNDTEEQVKWWLNRKIILPSDIEFTRLGNLLPDFEIPNCKYKILTYVDSIGCSSCKLQLTEWKELIHITDSVANGDVFYLFILHPNDLKEMKIKMKYEHFDYPACFDEDDRLNKLNKFASNSIFQTLLLNKDNKVLAIGNPIHNPKVKELYLKIIQEKTDVKEDNVIKTEIRVENPILSLGSFDWQKEQKVNFTIHNVGKHPLVINDVTTSCGCISVDYPKQPVHLGNSISLQVSYKADKPENLDKTITVYCNTEPSLLKLRIVGEAK